MLLQNDILLQYKIIMSGTKIYWYVMKLIILYMNKYTILKITKIDELIIDLYLVLYTFQWV